MNRILMLICLFTLPAMTYAQLSTNLEAVQYDDDAETIGVGASIQADVPISNKFRAGVKAGILYDVTDSDGNSLHQFPLLIVARRYLIGGHKGLGGIYAEGTGGVGIYKRTTDVNDVITRTTERNPQASIGIGWRLPILLDVGISLSRTFGDGETITFTGVKASLRF